MGVKSTKKLNKNVSNKQTQNKTTGQIDKDTIPAKDKNPDDMEII